MNTFAAALGPQLLAGLVSLVAGLVGVLIAFRLERAARRRDAVDDATERVLLRVSEYASSMQLYADEYRGTFISRPINEPRPPGPRRPSGFEAQTAIEILAMRTRRGQRSVVEQFADAWSSVRKSDSADDAVAAAGFFTGALSGWRTGKSMNLGDELTEVRVTAAGVNSPN
jgi:hypothetical protein